jgi:hypothetical protein
MGGYSLRGIRECGLRVLQELCGVSTLDLKKIDKIIAGSPQKSSAIRKVMEVQSKYWKVFIGSKRLNGALCREPLALYRFATVHKS